jgi:replicative DNA helicase
MNLSLNKPFILTVGSKSAVGKTTFMVALLSKILKPTEKVYFMTDDSERSIINKIKLLNTPVNGKVVSVYSKEKLEKLVNLAILEKFDYVVLDICQDRVDIISFRELLGKLRACNISVLVTSQLNRHFDSRDNMYEIRPSQLSIISDYVATIERRTDMGWFEKTIYKIFKFIPFRNMRFNLVKNRYGKEKRFNFHLNFNTLKITNF